MNLFTKAAKKLQNTFSGSKTTKLKFPNLDLKNPDGLRLGVKEVPESQLKKLRELTPDNVQQFTEREIFDLLDIADNINSKQFDELLENPGFIRLIDQGDPGWFRVLIDNNRIKLDLLDPQYFDADLIKYARETQDMTPLQKAAASRAKTKTQQVLQDNPLVMNMDGVAQLIRQDMVLRAGADVSGPLSIRDFDLDKLLVKNFIAQFREYFRAEAEETIEIELYTEEEIKNNLLNVFEQVDNGTLTPEEGVIIMDNFVKRSQEIGIELNPAFIQTINDYKSDMLNLKKNQNLILHSNIPSQVFQTNQISQESWFQRNIYWIIGSFILLMFLIIFLLSR